MPVSRVRPISDEFGADFIVQAPDNMAIAALAAATLQHKHETVRYRRFHAQTYATVRNIGDNAVL